MRPLPALLIAATLLAGCGENKITCVKYDTQGYCLRYEPICTAWVRAGNSTAFSCER